MPLSKYALKFFTLLALVPFALVYFSKNVSAATTSSLRGVSDGTYTSWTPLTGTSHYSMVSESGCDGNTTYNYVNSVGSRDSYNINLSSIPDTGVITAISIYPCASKHLNGGSPSQMKVFYRANGVDSALAGNYSLSSSVPSLLAGTSFSGLNINKNGSTTLQIGAAHYSGGKGLRLSNIYTIITYNIAAPSAPSAVDVLNISSSSNDITWTDNSSTETGFLIERANLASATGPLTTWLQIGSAPMNSTIFHNTTGLSANTTYYYRVRAYNGGGNSAYSNSDYAITATVSPTTPINLAVLGSGTTARLAWNDISTNEEGFNIERSTDDVNYTEIGTTSLLAQTYFDYSLPSGTYYYRVRARNLVGYSSYTSSVSVTIL